MAKFARFLCVILLLCGSVLFHEYGHYRALRSYDVKVIEFTVGFGPTLWSTTLADGTAFKVKPILLGGYTMPVEHGPGSIEDLSVGKSLVFTLAGMFFNVLLAAAALVVLGYAKRAEPPGWLKPLLAPLPAFLRPLATAVIMPPVLWVTMPALMIGGAVKRLLCGTDKVAKSDATVQAAAQPFSIFAALNLIFEMNVSLAGINFLPIPPLDGGRAAQYVVAALWEESAIETYTLVVFVLLGVYIGIAVLRAVFYDRR